MKGAVLSLILSALSFLSNAQTSVTLHGQVTGRKTGTIYLYSVGGLRQPPQLVDSVALTSEFFTFKRAHKEPTSYYISMNEIAGQLYFIWDKDIVVLLDPDELAKSTIEGSPTTEVWRSFGENVQLPYDQKVKANRERLFEARDKNDSVRIKELYQEGYSLFMNYRKTTIEFIQKHGDSWAGLYLLASCYKDLGRTITQNLFAGLSSSLQQSDLGKQMNATITDPDSPLLP